MSTQRAYTLRLSAPSKDPEAQQKFLDALWQTHQAVNEGARAFGDWLLTLRGGLDHRLADLPVKTKKSERPSNDGEQRDRRVLLALSWLCVERGTSTRHVVPRAENGR